MIPPGLEASQQQATRCSNHHCGVTRVVKRKILMTLRLKYMVVSQSKRGNLTEHNTTRYIKQENGWAGVIHCFTVVSRMVAYLCWRIVVNLQHDDVIKWKHFPSYWTFVRGIHRSPVDSPHKGQWRGALMCSLICAWINGWVNNHKAGDLRRHRAHYDVIVMGIGGFDFIDLSCPLFVPFHP